MKKMLLVGMVGLAMLGLPRVSSAQVSVSLYIDSAPDYVLNEAAHLSWESDVFTAVANGTFSNMTNGVNPANIGTTNFQIQDEVAYDFGNGGRNLAFLFWVPNTTVANLEGNFQMSLMNYWGNEPAYDFFQEQYGSTWLEPVIWYDVTNASGVSGVVGAEFAAWIGADGIDTQEALDADYAAWAFVGEQWVLSTQLYGDASGSFTATRHAVPEPATIILLSTGLAGAFLRKRFV